MHAGILCKTEGIAEPKRRLPAPATRDFEFPDCRQHAASPRHHRIQSIYALIRADIALRRISLWRIAERIRREKSKPAPDLRDPPPWDVESITKSFLRVRPWYPRNYVCLYDSLALMLLLESYRIRADWIFGVREDPFVAHCWVQHGETVLNDHFDRIRNYVPIMAI